MSLPYDHVYGFISVGHRRTKVPRGSPFYLIFRHSGYDKVGGLVSKEKAIEGAKACAANNPGTEYVVMKAEVLCVAAPAEVQEIVYRDTKTK